MSKHTFRPFSLGQFVITAGALDTIPLDLVASCVARHENGDWGDLNSYDARENTVATCTRDRILSSYKLGETTLWIVTEADRSVTTALLPSEY